MSLFIYDFRCSQWAGLSVSFEASAPYAQKPSLLEAFYLCRIPCDIPYLLVRLFSLGFILRVAGAAGLSLSHLTMAGDIPGVEGPREWQVECGALTRGFARAATVPQTGRLRQ